jgi:hypothetical protein
VFGNADVQRRFIDIMHNLNMRMPSRCLLAALLLLAAAAPLPAQDPAPADPDGSSEQVEGSDDAYRRRMELEDARRRDPLYAPNTDIPKASQEKIDRLPEKSRDNIREQLVDVIVENDEWEPFDALRDYPYTPTEAAQKEPELLEREQEAWDEQIEKYHQREAEAYAAQRGPVPGPGNPTGQEGGAEGAESGQQGAGSEGAGAAAGAGDSGDAAGRTAGSYEPYSPTRSTAEEEVSTEGVQESALDFLQGRDGRAAPSAPPPVAAGPAAEGTTADSAAGQTAAEQARDTASTSPAADESAAGAEAMEIDLRGIIAIEDLDKLQGTEIPEEETEPERP